MADAAKFVRNLKTARFVVVPLFAQFYAGPRTDFNWEVQRVVDLLGEGTDKDVRATYADVLEEVTDKKEVNKWNDKNDRRYTVYNGVMRMVSQSRANDKLTKGKGILGS